MFPTGRKEDIKQEKKYGLGWVLITELKSAYYFLDNRELVKVSLPTSYTMKWVTTSEVCKYFSSNCCRYLVC